MFNNDYIYEYLMSYNLSDGTDTHVWQALATKLFIDTADKDTNKIFDIIAKAKRFNIHVPDEEMATAWMFVRNNVEGKDLNIDEFEKLVIENGYAATQSNKNTIDV